MARAFAFRLEQVLNYRRQLEEAAIRRMAAAQSRLSGIREEQGRRRAQKDELADWFSGEERRGSFQVEEAAGYTDYLEFLSGLEKGLRERETRTLTEVE
ncbi:MAG TPA: hypothetical protein VFR02_09575, partial [bacterium]|nr:hypothetical protein [bacterium]